MRLTGALQTRPGVAAIEVASVRPRRGAGAATVLGRARRPRRPRSSGAVARMSLRAGVREAARRRHELVERRSGVRPRGRAGLTLIGLAAGARRRRRRRCARRSAPVTGLAVGAGARSRSRCAPSSRSRARCREVPIIGARRHPHGGGRRRDAAAGRVGGAGRHRGARRPRRAGRRSRRGSRRYLQGARASRRRDDLRGRLRVPAGSGSDEP